MADTSDIEEALVATVSGILYPSGSAQGSIAGTLCRVYRGWPNTATLNSDLSAGNVNVTVVSDNEHGRTTTRYLPEWYLSAATPGATVTAGACSVNIGGSPAAGDVIGVLIDNVAYAYRVQAGDSTALVAASLALSIQAKRIATASGSAIAIPGAGNILARVVCDAKARFESRRQEKDFRIVAWCPAPAIRDAIASAIDLRLSSASFLALADGSDGRIAYKGTASHDQSQNALLYRRDLVYTIEYPTIATDALPAMLFGVSDVNSNIIYG
jgi:hypothetical protein